VKILVGCCFGIGNSVLRVPALKALATRGTVDVLIGSGPDDAGASVVFSHLQMFHGRVRAVWTDVADFDTEYDVAVMAIPFDGRWRNGAHFRAKAVIDGRKRPGNVDRLGFDMWERHEVEYQMENAKALGYDGPVPSMEFTEPQAERSSGLVYLGLGYKRDAGGFGLSKHWGTERYVRFVNRVCELRPGTKFIATGDMRDLIEVGADLLRSTDAAFHCCNLAQAFEQAGKAAVYVGNDTGMMHVAASQGTPAYAFMLSEHLVRKNHPWGVPYRASIIGQSSPEDAAVDFLRFWDENRRG